MSNAISLAVPTPAVSVILYSPVKENSESGESLEEEEIVAQIA